MMSSFDKQREQMVESQIISRGITNEATLAAIRQIPREEFVPDNVVEFAYEDCPLPIEDGQTISQPFIVALMIEALELQATDRVLEIGAGSGYAAVVLSRIAAEVYSIERHSQLAQLAQERANRLGYDNVRIIHGDGTRGWDEFAPYDAIVVAAGGPDVPQTLLEQLKIGGRLVMPVGDEPRSQDLVRIRRTGEHDFEQDSLGRVQFVPLIGSEGWSIDGKPVKSMRAREPLRIIPKQRHKLSKQISQNCEPINNIETTNLDSLIERIGESRLVLIGEATHGTSEFYRMRAKITRELITKKGFNVVAIEADWPDTSMIDRHVRGWQGNALRRPPFSRFPTWMWRNREMQEFVDWLMDYNREISNNKNKVSIHGMDLYSLYNSIGVVLDYLDRVDPDAAEKARIRYGCFSPWESDPATYGRAAVTGRIKDCEEEVVTTLQDLFEKHVAYRKDDGEALFDVERNAKVVTDAEQYYRIMYLGSRESWNLRDRHMFDTIQSVLAHRNPGAKAVVWAHNSHVGNAAATEMGVRGELNIGQLAREHYGQSAYLIGFGTDHGTVAAASNWDEPVEFKTLTPSHVDSYERLCHESKVPAFLLPLRNPYSQTLREELYRPHLQRAVGVIYRPETEVLSHYFQAALPAQFDEYIWFDKTEAIQPIEADEIKGMPDTYPFGL
jgi:protein-L-isoaspartate(D-aspartate) O-methyltransferase